MINSNIILAAASASIIIASAVAIIKKKKQRRQRRCWTRNWLANTDLRKGNLNLLNEFREPDIYLNYVRMDEKTFENLLNLIRADIEKQNTVMREAISAKHRLIITLRFLATGNSYRSLMYDFRVSESTISQIVPQVCRAIYINLKREYLKVPTTVVDWLNIADQFETMWNFPRCLGAMDGKHIEFRAPMSAGSTYFNYKGSHSIVLLALVDAHYNFLYIDVGTNGRVSDGGVFRSSKLYSTLERNALNFPEEAPLPDSTKAVPYVIVADAAFPLSTNIIKPYPMRNMSSEMQIFNYRLSRARRVVENAFGILANRFRILLTTINLEVEKVQTITVACCTLHNFLSKECKNNYSVTDESDTKFTFKYGLSQQAGNRASSYAQDTRNEFCKYFNGVGSVSWQYDI